MDLHGDGTTVDAVKSGGWNGGKHDSSPAEIDPDDGPGNIEMRAAAEDAGRSRRHRDHTHGVCQPRGRRPVSLPERPGRVAPSPCQRGRFSVPIPAVMNRALAVPGTSAVCHTPRGLMTASPAPMVVERTAPSIS